MGVAQNALLGAGAAVGIAANKFATGIKSMISEANDAEKAKQMSTRAKQNSKQAVANKKEQMNNTLKKVEAANKGQNKDLKTKVLANELLRDR